ncbi:MAG: glycosyltransferase family 39 protein [Thermodesulfovibrionales bacterium]|nr:glycosyltransferase family 39 protein [Thermodesulfovibrionales bacterium]
MQDCAGSNPAFGMYISFHYRTLPLDLIELDIVFFKFINKSLANSYLDIIMTFCSTRGYLFLIPFLLLLLWQVFKTDLEKRKIITRNVIYGLFLTLLSFSLADWLSNELKYHFQRIRPCIDMVDVRLLVGCTESFSLPSNHSANTIAILSSLIYYSRKMVYRWAIGYLVVVAFFIVLSRIYVGVHYPSDIISGGLIGLATSFFMITLARLTLFNTKINIYRGYFLFFLISISIFRIYYIQQGPINLSSDEAHYWEWSRRLDLSYYSKGPMIAYLIHFGTSLLGDNVLGIRTMAVLFSILSSLVIYKLVLEMYGEKSAFICSLLFHIVPLFATYGVIFTIDSPFIFFWILSLYLFWYAITNTQADSSDLKPWILLGISVGLGLLTKFTMLFFFICGFLFLLSTDKKWLLKSYKPYLSFFIGIACLSPVIIWNLQHDWVTLKHTFGHLKLQTGLNFSLKSFFEFIGSQLGIITPIIFFSGLISLFKNKDEKLKYSFLLFFFLPIFLFFLLKSFHGKVQANWAMPAYISILIAYSKYFDNISNTTFRGWREHASKSLYILGILIAFLVTAISHYPEFIKLPTKFDPTSRLKGWDKLGLEVGRIYYNLSKQSEVIIFSDSYQVSSQLAFYIKGHPKTYCVNLGRRMNQYDLWESMNNVIINNDKIYNAIFVRIGNTEIPSEILESSENFEKKVLTLYDKKNQVLRQYSIFILYNFRGVKTPKPTTF